MKATRTLMAMLLVSGVWLVGCGGDGDNGADANSGAGESGAVDESDGDTSEGDGSGGGGSNDGGSGGGGAGVAVGTDGSGSIEFTLSGGSDASGTWEWVPAASYYSGSWSLSFTDGATGREASLITLSLVPDTPSISYTDTELTVVGTTPDCTFDIERQDEDGAAGSVECENLMTMSTSGFVDGGTNLRASFDVST